jgi:PRTRC genetic system protein C
MLQATQLQRVFIITEKEGDVPLTDPDPQWSVQSVLNFYANTYPMLATAKVSGPQIRNDQMQYRFETIMGTKG